MYFLFRIWKSISNFFNNLFFNSKSTSKEPKSNMTRETTIFTDASDFESPIYSKVSPLLSPAAKLSRENKPQSPTHSVTPVTPSKLSFTGESFAKDASSSQNQSPPVFSYRARNIGQEELEGYFG